MIKVDTPKDCSDVELVICVVRILKLLKINGEDQSSCNERA